MKKGGSILAMLCLIRTFAYSGSDPYLDKDFMQPAPASCARFQTHEWNLIVWGTYALPANTGNRDVPFRLGPIESGPDPDMPGTIEQFDNGRIGADRFINRNDAWGGGADLKFFFTQSLGIGLEGFVLDCNDTIGGAGLGTVTFRYPIGCSRLAPYAFAGFGMLSGGSHSNRVFFEPINANGQEKKRFIEKSFEEHDGRTIGQVGGGLELRICQHIGVIADYAWNVVDGADNNFAMIRLGVSLSF